jgi:hypothetical protein
MTREWWLDKMGEWYVPEPNTGCWLWLKGVQTSGYGQVALERKKHPRLRVAHRVSYELLRGPIPGGLTLDHLCRVRSCVNPDHLEPVTNRVNALRGNGAPARHARQTHCLNGHPLTPENIYPWPGERICVICERQRANDAYLKRCTERGYTPQRYKRKPLPFPEKAGR